MLLPPLRMKWGHLALCTQFTARDYTIGQLMHSMTVPLGHAVTLPDDLTLALMFDASGGQGQQHQLAISVVPLTGDDPVIPGREYALPFDSMGEGYRLFAPVRIPVGGWTLPYLGDYAFRLSVDGEERGRLPFRISRGSHETRLRDLMAPPSPASAPAIELMWVHLLGDFKLPEFRIGNLRRIVEVVRLQPRERAFELVNAALVFLLHGEMRDGISLGHTGRVRLLDGQGQPVIDDGSGIALKPEFQPMTENRLGRRTYVTFGNQGRGFRWETTRSRLTPMGSTSVRSISTCSRQRIGSSPHLCDGSPHHISTSPRGDCRKTAPPCRV